jgi:hypothetical protein
MSSKNQMIRWYAARTVDRLIEIAEGNRCSCFPGCARRRISKVVRGLVSETVRITKEKKKAR